MNASLHKHSSLLAAKKNGAFIIFLCFVIILCYRELRSNIHENDLKVFKLSNSSKGNGDRYRMPRNIDWEQPALDSKVFISATSREREFISVTILWLRLIMS